MAKVKCDIRKIVGQLGEPNSRNEAKVVAFATWANGDEKLNIRSYNVIDDILLSGINLTEEETEQLVYTLLSDPEIVFDRQKAISLIEENQPDADSVSVPEKYKPEPIDIAKMMQSLDDDEEEAPSGSGDYVRNSEGYIIITRKER